MLSTGWPAGALRVSSMGGYMLAGSVGRGHQLCQPESDAGVEAIMEERWTKRRFAVTTVRNSPVTIF
jgi:hypothetical protein